MDSYDNCLICLEKITPYLLPDDYIRKGNLPNFTELCKYLKIRVTPQNFEELKEVPWFVSGHEDKDNAKPTCEKFLCLDCFDKVYNLSKLHEQAEEIQRKIEESTSELRNVITRLSTAVPAKGVSRKRGRKPKVCKLDFSTFFHKLVKDTEGNVYAENNVNVTEKVKRISKRVKYSNSSEQAITNEDPRASITLTDVAIKVESNEDHTIEDYDDYIINDSAELDDDFKCTDAADALVQQSEKVESSTNLSNKTETLSDADAPGTVDIKTEVELPAPKQKRKRTTRKSTKKLSKSKASETKIKLKKIKSSEAEFNSLGIPTFYETINEERVQVRICPICNHKCIGYRANLGVFKEHTLSHENDLSFLSDPSTNELHKCSQCDQQFTHKLNLDLHKISSHEVRPFHFHLKCEHCDFFSSKSKDDLVAHLKSHSDTIHSCKSCPMSFTSLDSVLHHMNKHSRSKRLLCPECPFMSPSLKEVFKHCHIVHPDLKKKFPCNLCSKSFLMEKTLKSHMSFVHAEAEGTGSSHICTLCNSGRAFKTKWRLDNHIRSKHEQSKPHKCDQCPKAFLYKTVLQNHISTVHERIRYPCPHCTKSYSEQHVLTRHLKRHTGEGLFTCPTCGKQFPTKTELNIHSVVHLEKTPENACVCEICGKEFPSVLHLKRHKNVHKDKQLECEYCGKKFLRRDNFRGHLRTHTGERPFVCVVCSKGFNRKDIMIVHMKVHGMSQAEANQRYAEVNPK